MTDMENSPILGNEDIIDSLSEGVYICDLDRTITFWNKSAERITGWSAEDVIGRQCFDNVLCHIDKDGHQLCGEEYCPLHRSIVTGAASQGSLLVYAQGKDGKRVPMHVSVAPIRNSKGQIVGGVETFRDASETVQDLERAKAIQKLALQQDLPHDPRLAFTTHYIPHDIIGGDYFAIRKLDDDRYGLILADVTGHGIGAALYTMHLSQLWDRFYSLAMNPVEFAETVNNELVKVVKSDTSFATAVCGLVDMKDRVFRFAGAGGPQVLLMHADGIHECLENPGLPLAVMEDTSYEETGIGLQPGDSLLLFSDGAVEIMDANDQLLGLEGLLTMLRKQGYPRTNIQMHILEEELLKYSNAIRLDDDLTLIEIRISDS